VTRRIGLEADAEARAATIAAAHGRKAALAVFLLAAFAASCRTHPAPQNGVPEPVSPESQPASMPAVPETAEPSALDTLVKSVSMLIDRQEFMRARQMLGGALQKPLPAADIQRLRLMDEIAQRNIVFVDYVKAFIRVKRERVIIGERIEGDLIMINVSSRPISILADPPVRAPAPPDAPEPLPELDQSISLLSLGIRCREFWPDYSTFDSQEGNNIRLDKDVRLATGESVQFPFAIDTLAIHAGTPVVKRYELTAKLRCYGIVAGDQTFQVPITFAPAHAIVLPRNSEHLGAEPLEKMATAIAKEAAIHLTIAAAYVEPQAKSAAYRLLRAALEDPKTKPPMRKAIMTALRIASGVELGPDAERWIAWCGFAELEGGF
jgi:hypothetical protein